MLRLIRALDAVNATTGRLVAWLSLAMVSLGAYNALARYLGRFFESSLSSNAYIELQWYLFSALFLLGAADALRADAHVRVDVLHARLSPRSRQLIDLVGGLLLLLPFCAFALYTSWSAVQSSWAIRELSPDPGGLPRYPIKALILVAFGLLFLQGVSQTLKQVLALRGGAEPPGAAS